MNERGFEQLTLFQGGSRASRSAWQGSAEVQQMTVISGRKCFVLQKNSARNGLSGKMCMDLFEMRLTKSLKISSRRVTKQGHTLSRLARLARCSAETESLLWPRPTTGAPLCGGTHNFRQMEDLRDKGVITEEERRNLTQGNGGRSNPALMEWLMGFPIGWTDLHASETP